MSRVVVVGLGPGDRRHLSLGAAEAIAAIPNRYLRTARHPSAGLAQPGRSFDELYETVSTFDEVYEGIVGSLVEAADRHEEVLYAVPGSPLVAERSVELLRADERIDVEIVASISFTDLAWERLRVDPLAAGVRLVDGHRFAVQAAGQAGPLLVSQCDSKGVLSAIKLSVEDGPEVVVLQRLGLDDESCTTVAWEDLDRSVEPDHLTCLWVPELAEPAAAELVRFAELVATLRERCPWDRQQTHESLRRHLIEEAYEVVDAIDRIDGPDGFEHLEEELGDLLFQVAFHARLAAEAGEFDLAGVARGIHDKLVGRHPHVFGPPGTPAPDWEAVKAAEKGGPGEIPATLPALLYATKVRSRFPDAEDVPLALPPPLLDAIARVEANEVGEALFQLASRARTVDVDPESELRAAARRRIP